MRAARILMLLIVCGFFLTAAPVVAQESQEPQEPIVAKGKIQWASESWPLITPRRVLILEGRYPTAEELQAFAEQRLTIIKWTAPYSEFDSSRLLVWARLQPWGACDSEEECKKQLKKSCEEEGYKKDCIKDFQYDGAGKGCSGTCCGSPGMNVMVVCAKKP